MSPKFAACYRLCYKCVLHVTYTNVDILFSLYLMMFFICVEFDFIKKKLRGTAANNYDICWILMAGL
jgi:hypothetical protein